MKPFSLRLALLIQFLAFTVLGLGLFSYLLLTGFSRILQRDLDDLLLSKAQTASESLERYQTRQQAGAPVTRAQVDSLMQDWLDTTNGDSVGLGTTLTVFDITGNLIGYSWADSLRLPPDLITDFGHNHRKKPAYRTSLEVLKDGKAVDFRLVVMLLQADNGASNYLIQVGMPLGTITEPLEKLQVLILISLPLFLILMASFGYGLIRWSLRPLDLFIGRLDRINESNLEDRVLPAGGKEIRLLASNFNALLDRLQGAFESQRQVFEDMSHQLKTPLAVMKGELELALSRRRTLGRYQEVLASSVEEVDRMTALVEGLLKLARFDSHQIQLERSTFLVGPFLSELCSQVGPLAELRGLALVVDCPDELRLTADAELLSQAILNLLENAIKYASGGTTVWLQAREAGEHCALLVRDHGQVIPEDEIAHLFDRFYRGRSGLRTKGFGLGLAIVQSITQMHGGQVSVQSRAETGTEFKLLLPHQGSSEGPQNR